MPNICKTYFTIYSMTYTFPSVPFHYALLLLMILIMPLTIWLNCTILLVYRFKIWYTFPSDTLPKSPEPQIFLQDLVITVLYKSPSVPLPSQPPLHRQTSSSAISRTPGSRWCPATPLQPLCPPLRRLEGWGAGGGLCGGCQGAGLRSRRSTWPHWTPPASLPAQTPAPGGLGAASKWWGEYKFGIWGQGVF
jgi:hypothetical protein